MSRVARLLDIVGAVALGTALLIGLAIFASNNIADPNIWYDESGQFWLALGLHHDSVLQAERGTVLDGIWFGRNGFNLDPPGFTVMLAAWIKAFGSGIVSLRWLPFLLFCLTFVPAYLLATKALRLPRTVSVLIPALVLTIGLPLQYSTEIRAYGAELLAVVLTGWAVVRAYQEPRTLTMVILCLSMVFGATSTRYSFLVAAAAVPIVLGAAMVFGATLTTRWRQLIWPTATLAFIGLFTAWSVGLFGGGRQYDYGRGYGDRLELKSVTDWAALQERFALNLWRDEHQATGAFLIAGLVLAIVALILRQRARRNSRPAQTNDHPDAGSAQRAGVSGVLLLWGFVLAYEVLAVAFSYLGIVPWSAGDRWSMGLEAVALLSFLGLAGLAALILRPLLASTVTGSWSPIVSAVRWVAMGAFFVLAIAMTVAAFHRLTGYVHSDFKVAASTLPPAAANAFPEGVQVDWLVDYWSWPTFRYVVEESGTWPVGVPVTTATPIRLNPEMDGLDVLVSQPRCGPGLATAILHEDWGGSIDTRNAKFGATASQLRCVSTVYPLSSSESLIVLTAPGAVG